MTDPLLPRTVTQRSTCLEKEALTAKQVQYAKPDPARRQEVPAGPPAGLYLILHATGKKGWGLPVSLEWYDSEADLQKGFSGI